MLLTERMKTASIQFWQLFPIWNGAEREAGTAPLDKQIKREIICLKNLDTIFISIL